MDFDNIYLKFEEKSNQVKVTYYWFDFIKTITFLLLSMSAAVFSFLLLSMLYNKEVELLIWQLVLLVIATLIAMLGAMWLYISLLSLFNRTIIERNARELNIRHSPFPPMTYFENKSFKWKDITSSDVSSNKRRESDGEGGTSIKVSNRLCIFYRDEAFCLLESSEGRLSEEDLWMVSQKLGLPE
ncbi:MAG: hypothetical protein ACPG49_04915 [Chitinophagales bacterium]